MELEYEEFIKSKQKKLIESGFEIDESELNPKLFDFQKFIVKKALKAGRYAIFADCGLGKTFMQLEFAHRVTQFSEMPVLILAPLAVVDQTIREGEFFGIDVYKYDFESTSCTNEPDIFITNYEQLKNIDVSVFSGVVLDESSILKNFTGVYKNLLNQKFKNTKFKLACTATPSPNDLNEIGNHSEFLDVMDANDMRMRWFVRDEGMNMYRIKGHAADDFYGWIATWASVLRSPSDLGFDGSKYILPKLNFTEKQVTTESRNNYAIFNNTSVNATEFNKELKLTIVPRMSEVVDILNGSDEQFIIWVNQDVEEEYICNLIPDAVAVRGSDKPELKSKRFHDFAKSEFRVLVTKKKIAQFGLNFQNCRNQVFASLDFSFEGLYQAIRRSYRFGQTKEVNIFLITTDTMENVIKTINRKQKQFDEMMNGIVKNVNGNSFNIKIDYNKMEHITDRYKLLCGDSAELIKTIESNSIGFSVFSPPFSNLFTYSDNIRDMGNCIDEDEFFTQTAYLLKELYRVIKPGRLVAVHTKDLARYKNSSGYSGMYDFTGDYHRAMELAGFKYHSKITIWIDPVLEMQRTKTQRLLHKQVTKDSSYSGIGMPEYITIFRKWEGDESDWEPIVNKTKDNFSINTWQKWASPIWAIENINSELDMIVPLLSQDAFDNLPDDILKKYANPCWYDIKRTNVLNNYKGAKDQKDEKHICPLQLDIIERCIAMWSNKGDTVFTPFMGIGSEIYQAVKMGRNGIGIELKESYYDLAIRNVESVANLDLQTSLF